MQTFVQLCTLFFACNVSQMLEDLEVKWSVVKHFAKLSNTLSYHKLGNTLTIEYSLFSVKVDLIVEILFMLFSVYNTLKMSEFEAY